MRRLAAILLVLAVAAPGLASGQSAGEVERCFRNPAACGPNGQPAPAPPPAAPAAPVAAARPPTPDYATVLQSAEPERRKIQESLRTLDKYAGPIDGNLQSEATSKAIAEWQKGRGSPPVGKLTPQEAQQLNAEAARVPIRRIEPPAQTATAPPTPLAPPGARPTSNAEALQALKARLAERRKAAEPKAEAAAQGLVRDLKAFVAADGKGLAGEQFVEFAKWYGETRAAGGTVGDIAPAIDDYGDAKAGAAVTSEMLFAIRQGGTSRSHCLVFAWVEGSPRKNPQAFSCDDVAGVEKWKTEQALKSAWR